MSKANVIRGIFSQQAKTASKLLSGSALANLSLKNNTRTHFKDHKLQHTYAAAVTQVIEQNPGFSVPEIACEATKLLGLNSTCSKDLTKVQMYLSYFLAETSVGHTLASNGMVGLTPMGRLPRWYALLSPEAQALVPRRTYADNAARFGLVMEASVPAVLGSTIVGFRADYLAPSGFGKRRWISQINLQAISRTDVAYANFAKLEAKVREDRVEAKAKLEQAEAEHAAATNDVSRLMAAFAAMEARQLSANADIVAAVVSKITEIVPDTSLNISSVAATDPVPPAAVVAPRKKVGRPRRNPTA